MSNSPSMRQQHSLRDLNPRTSSPDLADINELRARKARVAASMLGAEGAGEVQSWVYVGPVGIDRHQVRAPRSPDFTTVVPSTQPGVTFAPGQRVAMLQTQSGAQIVGYPPGGERGHSRNAPKVSRGTIAPFAISSIDPNEFTGGAGATSATVSGTGFKSDDVLEAVLYDPDNGSADSSGYIADPHVTLSSLTFVDSETFTVDVTVSADLAAERGLTLRITRG